MDGSDALRKVELPFGVLVQLSRQDRRDVQVFDASGQMMPGKLVNVLAATESQSKLAKLAFFPVEYRLVQGANHYSFRFSAEGEEVAVNLAAADDQQGAQRQDYIVYADRETNKTLGDLVGLQFDWPKSEQNEVVPVRIEGSKDLEKWTVLNDAAVISELQHEGATLTKKQVAFKAFDGDYLRVTWPGTARHPKLTSVSGKFDKDHLLAQPWRHATIDCQTVAANDAASNECRFDIGGVPAAHLRVRRSDGDHFVQGELASRSTADAAWTQRGVLQQYHLTFDGATTIRDWNVLPGRAARYWKLTFLDPATASYSRQLEIRWRPMYAAFIAQGQPPYRLAVGAPVVGLRDGGAVDTVLKRSDKTWVDIETVAAGPVLANSVHAEFWTRDRIETYLLWAILIIGVAVMLMIAIGVYRRLEGEQI